MTYIKRLRKGVVAALAAAAMVFLGACGGKVTPPQPPTAQSQNYLLTLRLGSSDSRDSIQATYGGQILAWQPEAGFAIVRLTKEQTERVRSATLDGRVSLQGVTLEPDLPVASPEIAEAQGANAWAGGWDAWAGGWDAWAGGWDAWAGGNANALPGVLPGQNTGSWMQISLYQAHGISRSFGEGVKVAVIDTGVDTGHPMFKNRLAPPSEWRDFVDGDTNPQEVAGGKAYGHGTAVAGLILQVAPRATLLPIRVLNPDGSSSVSQVVSAINYAVDAGAQVVNVSIGTAGNSAALHTISVYAKSRGARIVASAGNEGKKDGITSPAQFSWLPDITGFVMGIGSVDANDYLSNFSNYGKALYATAPGEKLYSAFPGNRVAAATGTSFAAPLFSGAIALALSEMSSPADRAKLQTYLWNSLDFSVNEKNKKKSNNVQRLDLEALLRSLPGFSLPTQIQPGDYLLVNGNSGKCLEVSGGSTLSGANVQQGTCNNGAHQRWRIERAGNSYKLTSLNSGKALEVAGGAAATGTGANVDQADYLPTSNQQWLIQPNGANYQIVAAHSNKCLDVAGGSAAEGANVQQGNCNSTGAQQWELFALF